MLEFYFKADASTWGSLTNTGLGISIYNPNDPTQGTALNVSGQANYSDAVTNGAVISIPLTSANGNAYKSYDKDFTVDASIPVWELSFGFGLGVNGPGKVDQPIVFVIDDVVVKYVEPPLINPNRTPTGYQTTNDLTVTGTVIDGALGASAMELHLDGSMVATNFVTVSGMNTISYNAVDLIPGYHTAAVKAIDNSGSTNSCTVWYEWLFYVAGVPGAPSATPLGLYNINLANSSHNQSYGVFPVSNGTVAAAPSFGLNNWANIDYPNIWWLGNWTPKSIGEASGAGVFGNTGYESVLAGLATYGPNIWDTPGKTWANTYSNTIWATSLGGNNCNMNFELNGLDSDMTYDLYLYFTHPKQVGVTTNTYTITQGYAPSLSATLLSSQSAVSGGVQGTNYVVITQISPLGGEIRFNVLGGANGGGLSALQLVLRRPVATVEPTIRSMNALGGMVQLAWDSEQYIDYTILGKAALSDASWTAVSNLTAEGATTTVSVPMSGDIGFFKVEGE